MMSTIEILKSQLVLNNQSPVTHLGDGYVVASFGWFFLKEKAKAIFLLFWGLHLSPLLVRKM